jgi:hypothetical protein
MVAALLLVLFGVVALLAPLVSAHGANLENSSGLEKLKRAVEYWR